MSAKLSDGAAFTPVDYDPFTGSPLTRIVPTTEPQREVWLADRLGREASLAYNESVSIRFSGALNADALRGALRDLVERHESLRATISANGEDFCIASDASMDLPFADHSALGTPGQEAAVAVACQRAVETPFELEHGPLFRAEILKLGPSDHLLIVTAHHIVCDGWSFGVLVRDLARLYARRLGAPAMELGPPASFGDYALTQIAASGSPESAADETYWLSRFSGPIPTLDLPTDRPRSAWRTSRSRREDYVLDADLVSELRKVGARNGASLFATLLGGFSALLQRIAGSNDVVVGIPVAGQSVGGLDSLVGHCVNLLPLRVDVDPEMPMKALIAATQTAVLDAYEHQSYTFGTLLKKLAMERDPSRLPLVSVMFNLDQALDPNAAGFPDVRVEFASNPRSHETFELFVNAVQVNGMLRLECQYNADLFDGMTIRRWLACYETLLRATCASLDGAVAKLTLISYEDRNLLASWNRTSMPFSRTTLVHELIESQANRIPERTAVSWQGTAISYGTLDLHANRVAHCLRTLGVRRGALIGLHMERGPEMIVAALAAWKAGAAYVPLDPSYPSDRLAFMAEDAGLSVLVTESAHAAPIAWPRERTLLLDADNAQIAAQPATRLARDGDSSEPEDPAYVIYTSGSTGKPKGVRVPHRAVVNFLESMAREPGLSEHDRMVAVTTLSFDIAVNELFLPLSVGAQVVLAARNDATDGAALARLIDESGATIMQATPATWRLLIEAAWRGNRHFKALCGGEALGADLASQLLERTGALWNMYGPTETTVWSSCVHVVGVASGISIGRPIANTSVWILDDQQQLCPIGVPGEIWIGGDGVALGYLDLPELTTERFIADPFSGSPGARLYRTGDRGRWRADGLLEHLGRLDFQVKVRGYRVELGEIEVGLASHSDIARAVAIVREDRPNDVRLVAYVVGRPGATPDGGVLKAHLKTSLPDYMIPQHFMVLPAMPLLPNGKVDRNSLPAPDAPARPGSDFVAPRSDLEKAVAAEMEASIGMPGLSVHDDFFALGGHSLLAAQLTSRLNRSFKTNLSIKTLFEAPTVARLAEVIEADRASATSRTTIEHRADQSRAPLSQMQERLWLLEEIHPDRVVYNTPAAHRLHGVMNEGAFEQAFREMVRRQSALRTSIERGNTGVVQRIHDEVAIPPLFPAENLSALAPQDREARLRQRVDELCAQTFDLTRPPLFRARLFQLGAEEHVLFFMAHHIIWDGWSFDLFYDEMSALYGAFSEGRPSALSELTISYGDFAAWHREWIKSAEFDRQLTFWRRRLGRVGRFLPLPTDRPRRPGMSGAGSSELLTVDKPKVDALHELARQSGTTIYVYMLAAYCVMLYAYSRQTNLTLGTPVRGRNTVELEAIMGYFINLLPLQLKIVPEERFSDLAVRVKAAAIEIFANPDVPLEQLARELLTAGGKGGSVLYQALFSFQDARQRNSQWGALRNSRYPVFQSGATEDLGMWFLETTEGLDGGVTFNSDLFDRSTVQWLRERYFAILDAVIAAPASTVATLAGPQDVLAHQRIRWKDSESARIHALSPQAEKSAPNTDAEKRLAAIWHTVLGVEEIGIEDNFFDMGGHSLMVVQLIQEINHIFNVSLGVPELFWNPTLRQMAKLVTGREAMTKRVPAVVPLRSGNAEPPVYFIYAGPDEIRLARLMGEGHPIYGIDMPWPLAWREAVAANRKSDFPTMEQLAAPYAAALSGHLGAAPCVLAGHSFAGLIAFEVAHQIRKLGGRVELMVLLDAWCWYPTPLEIAREKWRQDWNRAPGLPYQLTGSRLRNSWHTAVWLFRQELTDAWSYFNRVIRKPGEHLTTTLDERGMPLPWELLERLYMSVHKPYQRRTLDCRGVLFRADSPGNRNIAREIDDSLGWKNLFSRDLEIIPIPGDHISMIRQHNPTFAREMNQVLQRHWPDLGSTIGIETPETRPEIPSHSTK